jgi:hypothetical protein
MAWKNLKNLVFAGIVALAIVGCARAMASIVTTTYEFLTDQSTVVLYGRGGPFTVYVEGQFQLKVDYDAGVASFDQVYTNDILGDSGVGDIFYMTELDGTVVSDSRIDFFSESTNPTFPGRDILLVFTFTDDSVHLTSSTFYPRYAMDAGFCVLDAIAVPEPATLLLISLGGLFLRKKRKIKTLGLNSSRA